MQKSPTKRGINLPLSWPSGICAIRRTLLEDLIHQPHFLIDHVRAVQTFCDKGVLCQGCDRRPYPHWMWYRVKYNFLFNYLFRLLSQTHPDKYIQQVRYNCFWYSFSNLLHVVVWGMGKCFYFQPFNCSLLATYRYTCSPVMVLSCQIRIWITR